MPVTSRGTSHLSWIDKNFPRPSLETCRYTLSTCHTHSWMQDKFSVLKLSVKAHKVSLTTQICEMKLSVKESYHVYCVLMTVNLPAATMQANAVTDTVSDSISKAYGVLKLSRMF